MVQFTSPSSRNLTSSGRPVSLHVANGIYCSIPVFSSCTCSPVSLVIVSCHDGERERELGGKNGKPRLTSSDSSIAQKSDLQAYTSAARGHRYRVSHRRWMRI